MKKMNVVLLLLLALTIVLPASMSLAAKSAPADQAQVQMEKININTADEAALASVPGIGPKTAEKIRLHREANGSFQTLDDLTGVKGIGEKSLQKMKPYLTI